MLKDKGPRAMKDSPDATAVLDDFTTDRGEVRWGIELAKSQSVGDPDGGSSATSPAMSGPISSSHNIPSMSQSQPGPTSTTPAPEGSAASPATVTRRPLPQLGVDTDTSATAGLSAPPGGPVSPVARTAQASDLCPLQQPAMTAAAAASLIRRPDNPLQYPDSPVSPISTDEEEEGGSAHHHHHHHSPSLAQDSRLAEAWLRRL